MSVKRGQCDGCGRRHPLRKDGTIGAHPHLNPDCTDLGCEGSGKPPRPFDPNDCGDCMAHRFSTPGLMEACYSVSIETRKTAEALMWDYLVSYHENGHREPAVA